MPGAAKPGLQHPSCHCRAREPQLRKPCAPRPEPECRVPKLCARGPRSTARCRRSQRPRATVKTGPCLPQLEKARVQHEDSAQPKTDERFKTRTQDALVFSPRKDGLTRHRG